MQAKINFQNSVVYTIIFMKSANECYIFSKINHSLLISQIDGSDLKISSKKIKLNPFEFQQLKNTFPHKL